MQEPSEDQLENASGGFFGVAAAIIGTAMINGADSAKGAATSSNNLARLNEARALKAKAAAKKAFHEKEQSYKDAEQKLTDDLDGLDLGKLADYTEHSN